MGISFKVSKNGRRFQPKPLPQTDISIADVEEAGDVVTVHASKESGRIEFASTSTRKNAVDNCERDDDASGNSETQVSFTLSLFPDGYSIGKSSEFQGESKHQTSAEVPKYLHPYDRASETLFLAIESGHLPGDLLDDIPCKYINGMLVCEVQDYRKCFSEAGTSVPCADGFPVINKVCLRMSLENVVKDIPSISDGAWTYGDLMEVESRIVKALQPKLCLDPTPKLDRLGENPTPTKLNLSLYSMRRKRLRHSPDVTVTSSTNIHVKKVSIDRVPESSRFGDSGPVLQQPILENMQSQNNGANSMLALRSNSFGVNTSVPSSPLVSHPKYQRGVVSSRFVQDHRSGAVLNASGASVHGQAMIIIYTDNMCCSTAPRRDNQEVKFNSNKRSRVTSTSSHGNQQQLLGLQMESFHGLDSHWKNKLLQQQSLGKGIQYANAGKERYPQQIFDGGLNQGAGAVPFTQGMRYGLKEETLETEKLDKPELVQTRTEMHMLESELNQTDNQRSRLQRIHQQLRPTFAQAPWNNLGLPIENSYRRKDPYQKKKLSRISAGGIPQSPLSSKSGKFSSGSMRPQVGAAVTSGYLSSQKEKSIITSVPPIGGAISLTSSANDSIPRQHQAQIAAKQRSNSLPKTPAVSGVGSPSSVNYMSVPISVGSPPLADPVMIDRFFKIDTLMARFQLNCKKNKVDEYPIRKTNVFSEQQLLLHLSGDLNNENFKDELWKMPLSTSLVGGSINVCKTRVLNFMLTGRIVQGNSFSIVPKARTRLIMSEKPNDGTVAFHIGEIEDAQYLAAEDYLPTLPNAQTADSLAAQFCSLMIHEGYHVEDHVQPRPIPTVTASSKQPSVPGVSANNATAEMQQHSVSVSGLPSNDTIKPYNSGTPSLNLSTNLQGTRMLAPGNVQGLQIYQGLQPGVSIPARPQQPDAPPTLKQQQQQLQNEYSQQHPQLQRSPSMLNANPMLNTTGQNSNMQLGNHMANKPSPLQILQQQQQQQQQMQRKMMMGLGIVGMGTVANDMVGLGGMGNVMGMRGVRAVGGTGTSTPMASIAGMGNMAQSTMNLSQASNRSNVISRKLGSGTLTQIQAAIMATNLKKAAQNRANMLGGPQSSNSGITGPRQMHTGATGLSMLGPALNRGNINHMQRTTGKMGLPKLMSGVDPHMTQQQQLQQQLQQQQQPETTSPLQTLVSSPQVGSPSNMGMP